MSDQRKPDNDKSSESEAEQAVIDDLSLTPEEEEQLKKKIEELRKRDPFIYR